MDLRADGHPLHTRSLTLMLSRHESGQMGIRGDVIDLRKCGVVPVPGGLQPPGIIHHMIVDALVDPGSRTLESLDVSQPFVAFEPSEASRGECCRDPAANLDALLGQRLDSDFTRTLSATFAGPRGCSHLLALMRLLASAVPDALDHVESRGGMAEHAAGERLLWRTLYVDGFETEEGRLLMTLQLSDVHPRPVEKVRRPMDRLDYQAEVRVRAEVDLKTLQLTGLRAAQRRRNPGDFSSAPWSERPEVGELVGRSVMVGLGDELLRRFAGNGRDPETRRLLDVLLNLAPGFIQCMAALTDRWLAGAHTASGRTAEGGGSGDRDALSVGGTADSCYMWRREGALIRVREQFLGEDPDD